MRVRHLLPLLLVLVPAVAPAGAAASGFQQIFGDYKDDGRLDGCYKPHDLYNAGRQIPPDIEQYAPGFGDALSSAQGGCSAPPADEADSELSPPVSAGTPGPGAPASMTKKAVKDPPAPKVVPSSLPVELAQPRIDPATARASSDTPGALIALLIAAGLAVVLGLAWTVAWLMGWSPERLTKPLFAAFESVWDRVLPGRSGSP